MDSNGTSKIVITRRFFGKIIIILSRNPELSRKAKIRLFKTYVESKVNHLIPLMAVTEGIKQTWSTMRNIIFRKVLNKSTLPRESATLFKLSYFNLIVKPVLKTLERAIRANGTMFSAYKKVMKNNTMTLLKYSVIIDGLENFFLNTL